MRDPRGGWCRTWRLATLITLAGAVVPAAAAQESTRREIGPPPAIVTGRIVGPDKKALEQVDVVLGDSLDVTDRHGRFLFDPVAPGMHEVLVRKIGFAPVRFRLSVTAGDVWDGTITLLASAQSLPEVVVLDSTKSLRNFRPAWLTGFVDRRRIGLGNFYDRVDIEKANVNRVAYLLSRIPGIHAREMAGYDQITVARCQVGAPSKGVLWVDGIKMETTSTGRFAVLGEYQPEELWGVEIYRGRGSIPPQYDDPQACLVIVLWTNRR